MIINIGDPLYRPFPKGVAPLNLPAPGGLLLALLPSSIVGGNPSSGIAGLSSPAPAEGTTVSLKTDRPEIVSLPKNITVAEKATAARFPVT